MTRRRCAVGVPVQALLRTETAVVASLAMQTDAGTLKIQALMKGQTSEWSRTASEEAASSMTERASATSLKIQADSVALKIKALQRSRAGQEQFDILRAELNTQALQRSRSAIGDAAAFKVKELQRDRACQEKWQGCGL